MKTFYQFNESIAGALKKFGSEGLRKAKVKYAPKYASKISKGVRNLFKPKNVEKFQDKTNKIMSKSLEFGKPLTKTHKTNRELGTNLIAKNRIKNNQPFHATTPPLATKRLGYQGGVASSPGAGEVQLYGKLKGGEYKVKMSGKGDKGPSGVIAGYRGKGNKALRRSGQADKITDYTKTGMKPTPMFRKTKSELGSAISDISKSGLQTSPHKFNKGDLYGVSVDIKQSKEKSRRVREFIRQNQKRMANIKKGKGPLGMSEDKTSKPVYGDGHDYTKGVALTGRLDFGKGKKSEYDVGLSYKGSVLARKTRKFDKPEKTSPKDAVDAALNKLNKKTPDKGGERTT